MLENIERRQNQTISDERQHQRTAIKVKRALGQHGVASEQRVGNLRRQFHGPFVVLVVPVCKGHDETRIRDTFHALEKPFREERFRGPVTAPASRMKALPSDSRAFSNCCRMIRPCGIPVFFAV